MDLPPEAVSIDDGPIADRKRNLAGALIKTTVSPNVPTIQMNSSMLSVDQGNILATLANIDDTFLSLKVRDNDLAVRLYRLIPTPTEFRLYLPPSSITRLDKALDDASQPTLIEISGIFATPDEGGTNLFDGGSTYDPQTREIVLNTPLGSDDDVFVSFTYSGWLVDMQSFPRTAKGGYVDIFDFDVQFVGA